MMDHRILPLTEKDGLPVVPTVEYTVPGEILSLYAEVIPAPKGARNRWTRRLVALATRIEPGLYRVWAEAKDWPAIDPLGAGKTQTDFIKLSADRAKLLTWEVEGTTPDPKTGLPVAVKQVVKLDAVPLADATAVKPWTVAGITVTKAAPSIPSEIAGYGMKAALTAVAVAPKIVTEPVEVIK